MRYTDLVYDGSFEGLLCCIFQCYQLRLESVNIQKQTAAQSSLFGTGKEVITNISESERVWKGLQAKLSRFGCNTFYYAFLSEQPDIENLLTTYARHAFSHEKSIENDYAHPAVLKVSQIAKQVGREKHRMEAFVRFKLTKDQCYFANIEPDFNVLPLIAKHFKSRYADQKWIIYDISRRYGLYYDLNHLDMIEMDFAHDFDFTKTSKDFFAVEELDFQSLWQTYFKSTNIVSRKNTKLHLQYVPRRYWKYLSEKQPEQIKTIG